MLNVACNAGQQNNAIIFIIKYYGFIMILLGRAAVGDCGTPWTFLFPFFIYINAILYKKNAML